MYDEKAEVIEWWRQKTGVPLTSNEFDLAGYALGGGPGEVSLRQLAELGVALWWTPPAAGGTLTPGQALNLASEALRSGIADDVDPGALLMLAHTIRRRITAVHTTPGGPDWPVLQQQAAADALRQLGGPTRIGLPRWMSEAVQDPEWGCCDHLLDAVATACAKALPGRRWCDVPHLGVITFRTV